MPAFDEKLDVVLKEESYISESDGSTIFVSLRSYNGADPKVQMGPRSFTNSKGEIKFRKLGRLTIDQAEWLSAAIGKILKDA